MFKHRFNAAIVAVLLFDAAFLCGLVARGNADEASPEFGVMANSDDMRRNTSAENAALMKEIGYKSVTVSCGPGQFEDSIKAYRDVGLRVGAVYVGWTTDGRSVSFNIPIDLVFERLRDTGAIVMIHTNVAKGAQVTERRIAEQLLPLAEQAEKAGVTVAIYPHVGNRLPTFADAARVADAVKHPALGACFNLCHFLKQNDAADLPAILRAGKDRIKLVTVNGAAVGNTRAMDWDKLIQPLGQGEFDLAQLLELICGELKYEGPIYVQCYNLKAPARTILQGTFDRWQHLKTHCRKPGLRAQEKQEHE